MDLSHRRRGHDTHSVSPPLPPPLLPSHHSLSGNVTFLSCPPPHLPLLYLHLLPLFLSLLFSLGCSFLPTDLTSRPRSPPQPPPPPLPPGRPPPPTPPQERGNETELGGGGGGTAATAGGGEGAEDWEEREAPLRQLEGVEGEEREGGRARAIDNQYSFF